VTVTPLLAGALAAFSVAVGLLAVPLLLDKGPVDRLAERTGGAVAATRRAGPLRRLVEWLAAKFGPRLVPTLSESRRTSLGHKLDLAGRPADLTVQRFLGLKAALSILFGGVMLLLWLAGGSLLLAFLTAGVAWFVPDYFLARTGRIRQERIERDLPDFLDILAVTVRAGLGYRAALLRVAESLGGPVGDETMMALRQMELGASRRAAFLAMRDRNQSDTLSSFVAAQLQAEELGVPLSEALNDIAADVRRAAHQAARRRAQRATPRVSLIITSLILPGTMIVIGTAILISSGILESGLP
jgi:tight adherence protein C